MVLSVGLLLYSWRGEGIPPRAELAGSDFGAYTLVDDAVLLIYRCEEAVTLMQQRSPSTLTFPHIGRSRWLRALGVLVAAIGRYVAYGFIAESVLFFLLTCGLAGVIGGLLWRTWRALFVVPAVLWLGAVAAAVLYSVSLPGPVLVGAEVEWALDLVVLAALPAVLATAIGVAVGMRVEMQLSR